MSNIAQTLNVYYTVAQYIPPTGRQAPAIVDEKLIFPLIKDASQFQVGLVKAKVPLDTIPLTQSNIPFHAWEIELRKGSISGSAYVEQLNSQQSNYIWNAFGGTVTRSQYSPSGVLASSEIVYLSEYVAYIVGIAVDDYENIYVIGSSAPNGPVSLFYVFSNSNPRQVYYSDTGYSDLQCISIDRAQNIYLASKNSGVYVFSNINSDSGVALTLIKTLTEDFVGSALTNIVTVCSDNTTIIGYDTNKIQLYDSLYNPVSSPITLSEILNLGNYSAILGSQNAFVLSDVGVPFDDLYGIQVGGDGTCFDLATGEPAFLNGNWGSCPTVCLDGKTALGVGLGTGIFYTVPNKTTSNPAFANTTFVGTSTCSNTFNTWYARLVTDNVLTTYNSNESLSVFDSNFLVTSSPLVIIDTFDINKIDGKLICVGNDHNLYMSNEPVLPNQIWTELPGSVGNTGSGAITTTGVGQGVFNTVSTIGTTSFTGSGNPNLGFYDFGTYYLVVQADYSGAGGQFAPITGGLNLYTLDRNKTQTGHVAYTSADLGGGCAVVCECVANRSLLMVANGQGSIYAFDVITMASVPSAIIDGLFVTPNLFITICNTESGCCVSEGTNFFYFSYNSGTQAFEQITETSWISCGFERVYGMCNDGLHPNDLIILGQQATLGQIALFYCSFGSSFSGIPSSAGPFSNPNSPNGYLPQTKFIGFSATQDGITSLQLDSVGHKICIPSSTINGFDMYWIDGANKYLDFLPNPIALAYQSPLFISPENPTGCVPLFFQISSGAPIGYYTYNTPITFNPALSVTINAVTMGSSSNNIYFTDTTGNVYKGSLVGTVVENWSALSYTGYQTICAFKSVNVNSSLVDYTISNQQLIKSQLIGSSPIVGVTRNVVTGEFIVSTGSATNNLISYPAQTLAPANWTSTFVPSGCIFAKNGENIDAGPAPIYSYQVIIDAINVAFKTAFVRANINGAGLLTAPSISLNFTTGLCTLTYDEEYVNSLDGLPLSTDGILFSPGLNNLLIFNSNIDIIDPTYYLVYLSANGTAPYSTTQNNKSITTFNMLDKILFSSTTIYVSQSFIKNNQSNNVITDVDIDTSGSIDNSGWLLYQPNFLRPFALASNNAIDRVQLYVQYSYIDGTTYPLLLNPGSGWNAKLDFIKKFSF